eukprot:IDg18834t1
MSAGTCEIVTSASETTIMPIWPIPMNTTATILIGDSASSTIENRRNPAKPAAEAIASDISQEIRSESTAKNTAPTKAHVCAVPESSDARLNDAGHNFLTAPLGMLGSNTSHTHFRQSAGSRTA